MADREDPQADAPKTAADGFAQSPEESRERFLRWRTEDPFARDVEPALLNSGDIADYVAATGMIHPFRGHEDKNKLKLASYEVDFLGRCVTFSGDGRDDIQIQTVQPGDEFVLGANEIAFVQLEPYFRIPEYLALRFNLRITHVYRGLLLGTGPLVDPGFEGHLWIPLHNLTSNSYVLRGGEGLVWMEFTKVSRVLPASDRGRRQHLVGEFPEEKKRREDILDYLRAADPHRGIRSSIPAQVEGIREQADDARDAARDARRLLSVISIAVVLAAVAVVYGSWQLLNSVRDRAEDALQRTTRIEQQINELRSEQMKLNRRGDRSSP